VLDVPDAAPEASVMAPARGPAPLPREAEDRPRRRPPAQEQSQGSSGTLLIAGLVGCGVLSLVMVGAIVILVVVLLTRSAPPGEGPDNNRVVKSSIPLNDTGPFRAPAPGNAPATSLVVVSSPGDFIGQGRTYSYKGG